MAGERAFLASAFCLLPCALLVLAAQEPQTPPRFRAGVDIFEFEISVLDRNREPVHGLRAVDFTVLENGRVQPIVGFSEVEFPEYDGPLTTAVEDVAPDVTSTRYADRRLFAVIMDDWGMPESPTRNLHMTLEAKAIGKFIVDRLAASDFAGIVLTRDTRYFPDFTNDRWKLFGNINEFRPPAGAERAYLGWITRGRIGGLVALGDVAQYLAKLPQHRKAIIYVSIGQLPRVGSIAYDRMVDAMRIAREAGIPIYAIDPSGLKVGGPGAIEGLKTLAENTGGSFVVNTNDFRSGVLQAFYENQSYYLLGYQQTGPRDGKFRRIEVRVNRPGLTAYTRSGRYGPGVPDIVKPPPPPVDEAVDQAVEALGRAANRRLAAYAVIRSDALEVVGEIGAGEAAAARWAHGADVEARVTRGAGEFVAAARGRIGAGDRSVLLNIPANAAHGRTFDPRRGPLHVSVKVEVDGSSLEAGADATVDGSVIGEPIVFRARSARGPRAPVADFQFTRTERLEVQFPRLKPLTERHVRLLRRTGELLTGVPELQEQDEDGRALLSGDLNLSFLARGDYVYEVFVRSGEDADRKLIAFRVR